MSLNGITNEEKIWNYFIEKGLNEYGAAGLLGNLYAESGLMPNNLQNNGNTKLGVTDDQFVAMVDNGTYAKDTFVNDGYGVFLAQWTYYTRKQSLYEYWKSVGGSIGDLEMQLDFLYKELSESYKSVLNTLKTATTVLEASNAVLTKFEKPADQSTSVQTKRAGYGQTYYDKYAKTTTISSSTTTLEYSVGDIVDFTGTVHYKSSTATSGSTCTAGVAKVTALAKSATHPYHLIRESGGGSTVYGWVNADTISGIHTDTTTSTSSENSTGGTDMGYTNSSLVDCTVKSPNHSGTRTHKIDRITPHCVVGQLSAESIGNCFTSSSRQASCNYGIGYDGRVCLVVDEQNRSWCSSSNANDQRAITIECASDTTSPYAFKDACYNKLVKLCIDICKRNSLTKVLWMSDKDTALAYTPKTGECVLTVHRWFANKSCPGDWLYNRMSQLASDINSGLGTTTSSGSSSSSGTATTTTTTSTIAAGTKLSLSNVAFYSSSGTATKSSTKSGTYYIWSTEVVNNRIRITNSTANVGKSGQVTAWISYTDAKNSVASSSSSSTSTSTTSVNYTVTFKSSFTIYTSSTLATKSKTASAGTFTIIEESSDGKAGKLKSGTGWVKLADASSTTKTTTTTTTFTSYKVKVTADVLNVRKGAGTGFATVTQIKDKGTYTIVDESDGTGATKWGLLKSYEENRNGWISLDYCTKV